MYVSIQGHRAKFYTFEKNTKNIIAHIASKVWANASKMPDKHKY